MQEFGTLASWGVDLINILTGNLDRPGGAMFPTPAAPLTALTKTRPFGIGQKRSRVSGQLEVKGMIPSSTMAEEILTPGEGQVRAMILVMTNPLRSAANSAQLEAAFSQLDFLVAIDIYINETTRHAHLILPTPTPAEQPNYEFGLYHLSVRNVAKWSSPAVSPPAGVPEAWQVLLKLSAPFLGMGDGSIKDIDDAVFGQLVAEAVKNNGSWAGLTEGEVKETLDGAVGPERVIDMLVRIGPYGDGFGRRPEGLTLAKIQGAEHGIDLGPLQPRLREVLNTKSGMIEMAPSTMTDDLARLRKHMAQHTREMVLIGRRVLRTSNSFMHNLPSLVKGPDNCTLQISQQDATRIGLMDGSSARITSRVGSVIAPVEVTKDLMPGVVSLPHGWGHDAEGSQLTVAKAHPGANANALTDNQAYDEASGTAVLFGTPVTIEPLMQPPSGSNPSSDRAITHDRSLAP